MFDDLVFSNKKNIRIFYKIKKIKRLMCFHKSHRYFCIDRLIKK